MILGRDMTEEVHSSSRKRKRIVSDEEVVKDNKMNCELLHCGYMNTISNRDCRRGGTLWWSVNSLMIGHLMFIQQMF